MQPVGPQINVRDLQVDQTRFLTVLLRLIQAVTVIRGPISCQSGLFMCVVLLNSPTSSFAHLGV